MQSQILLNIQQLEIKQSVVNSLGMFLAIAEGYLKAKGINLPNPLFAYYDHFNITRDPPELIRLKLLNNYEIFMAQKQNYLNIFREYNFYPDNLPVQALKDIIKNWIPYAKYIHEEKLYNDILLAIYEDEEKIVSYYDQIKNTPKTPNGLARPLEYAKSISIIHHFKDEEMKNNLEKWKNQEYPTVDIIIGGKSGTSKLSQNLRAINNLTDKEIIEKMNKEKNMSNIINTILYKANRLKDSHRKDEKESLRGQIKEETENLENQVNKYKQKYKSLDGLWTIVKDDDLEKQIKSYINDFHNNDKQLMENLFNIFFEDNNEKMN